MELDITPTPSAAISSYSKEEWEQKRPIITQLYRDEEKSLDHVRSVLAQQSFRPTEDFSAAMLKKRIKKWDLDRKHKQPDMLYAVKIALERESQGKKTAFLIRGRVVSFEEVQYYFRRKGVRDLRALVNDMETVEPTTRIECHTPEPPGLDSDYANQLIPGSGLATESFPNHIQQSYSSSEVIVIPEFNQVARTIQQSTELKQLDQILHYGRDYYNGILEKENWRNQQESLELHPLESFYHRVCDGHMMLDGGQVNTAFKHFECAFDLIKGILERGTLLFLPYLYHMFLPVGEFHEQGVLLRLLDFISRLIQERFPHLRPIQDCLILLQAMPTEQRENCSIRVFKSLLDQLKSVFKDDVPDKPLLRGATAMLCAPTHRALHQLVGGTGSCDNYKLASLAVWKLSRDAELLQSHCSYPCILPWDELSHHFGHCNENETSNRSKGSHGSHEACSTTKDVELMQGDQHCPRISRAHNFISNRGWWTGAGIVADASTSHVSADSKEIIHQLNDFSFYATPEIVKSPVQRTDGEDSSGKRTSRTAENGFDFLDFRTQSLLGVAPMPKV
ncbi:hypothetical protein L207DRAFT_583479 [Hyaloscypha variabilis F]|uniref:Clr5 domain-containing protein n=1 Tax=Hyaloscypha variabilis (strain UAMH 11265 / GT02V1 / F) TaxID=1149755 RepID=A0A2J6RM65_HYAVF|nr:hypothetical protein L207DRAFT_583479 [Hyaloscypha variabilis F]